jgi:hypothetical protein
MVNYTPNSEFMPGEFVARRDYGTDPDFRLNPAFFESILDAPVGANAAFTLNLRVLFVKQNRSAGATYLDEHNKPVQLLDWDESTDQFRQFIRKVKDQAEDFWNKKFYLIPPDDYAGLDWPTSSPTNRPNVECRFQLNAMGSPSAAHAIIDCYRTTGPRQLGLHACVSYQRKQRLPPVGGRFKWIDTEEPTTGNPCIAKTCRGEEYPPNWDPIDPTQGPRTVVRTNCRVGVSQWRIPHEIGHLLGLPHVGEFFRTGGAYEGRNEEDCNNIMGVGMRRAEWNVLPWVTRRPDHTGIHPRGWRIALAERPPRLLRAR